MKDSRRLLAARLLMVGNAVVLSLLPGSLHAATPPSGTVSEGMPASWGGTLKPATASATCNGPNNSACDNFRLTIVPPSPAFGPYVVDIKVSPQLAGDWDLQVYDPSGNLIQSSGSSPGQLERIVLSNPAAGTYTVAASPFAPVLGPDCPEDPDLLPDSYCATAEILPQDSSIPPPGGEPLSYSNHVPPSPLGRPGSAEASIGVNYDSDKVFYLGFLETLRITFDDCSSPAKETWEDKSFVLTSQETLDPILFTDRVTGRTFVSQLAGKTSLMAFSDDDGETWTPSQGAGINSGVDHQTIGGGPFASPLTRDPNGPLYPHAVYYCSQDIVTAQCARSDTGGLTFGPAVPIYNLTECGGLHGQIKVSPKDGTVYVPNRGCDGDQAVVVSENNGTTWAVRKIIDAIPGALDPSVGVANDGTVYFGWNNGSVQPMVAVSHDKGMTWNNHSNVGAAFNITNSMMPAVVAGDGERAAMAFLGSSESTRPPGSGSGDDPDWPGDWFLYVAHTYDGGVTWTTVNATPNDPVQRGSTICSHGIDCENGTRNLLDFMGATIDRFGRVLVGYQDGCVGSCVQADPNSFTARATIARQVNGRRLYKEFDRVDVPAAPLLTATFTDCEDPPPSMVHLSWSPPDDNGSPITGYNLYRRTSTTPFSQIASLPAGVTSYDDTIDPSQTYFYRVTAVNALGEGAACGEVEPGCVGGSSEDPCRAPGVTVLTDPSGDTLTPNQPQLDIESLSVAGLLTDGVPRMTFTMKVANLTTVPPNASWRIVWTFNGINYFVAMNNCSTLSGVTFTYGTLSGNLFSTLGPADAGSFTSDGRITITIAASKVGNPASGQALTSINGRSQTFGGAECSGLLVTQDITENGGFTLSSCVAGTPIARDDAATTTENNPVVINVLANDTDPNGDPLTVTGVTQGANGSVANNGDGTVTYRPDTLFHGTDSFTYTISDPGGLTDTASVTVTVNPFCPREPTGRFFDDLEPTPEPGWQVDTVENNLGPLSPSWQAIIDPGAQSPFNSFFSDATTLDLKDDRLVAPPQDLSSTSRLIFWHRFRFEETFDGGVLEVSTDNGGTWVDVLAGGGVFIEGGYNGTIDAGFNSPIAGRQAWTGGFLDAVLAPMERVEVDMGAFSGLDVRVRFRLAADPLAIGSLPGHGWWIDDIEFTNTLEISDCPRPPLASDDAANTTENTSVVINVLANDTDPEGGPLTVDGVTQPANGTATTDGTTVTYSPNTGFTGTDAFTYTIEDNQGLTDTANVTVTVTEAPNNCPDAVDDMATTERNTPVTIDVLENDTDPDGDPLTVTNATDPPHGSVVVNQDGTVTYTPDAGFAGTDSFTYTITDGRGCTDTATVTITVTEPVNHPPDAVDDAATTQQDTPVTIPVLANDSDPDGDSLTVTAVAQPAHGTAVNNGDGTVTYTPSPGFSGTDSFTYTISDPGGLMDTATVTVTVDPAPTPGGKVSGGGWIPAIGGSGRSNFGFNAKEQGGAATGRITYDAGGGAISLKGTVERLSISGSQATFNGPCEQRSNGAACTYTVQVADNADPGTGRDTFSITIRDGGGAVIHANGGVLGDGNIQVH